MAVRFRRCRQGRGRGRGCLTGVSLSCRQPSAAVGQRLRHESETAGGSPLRRGRGRRLLTGLAMLDGRAIWSAAKGRETTRTKAHDNYCPAVRHRASPTAQRVSNGAIRAKGRQRRGRKPPTACPSSGPSHSFR